MRQLHWQSSNRQNSRRLEFGGARRLGVAASIILLSLAQSVQVQSQQSAQAPTPTFSEVIEFVQKQGWQVNLGALCVQIGLPQDGGNCVYKQINVEEIKGRGDPRGFNVPAISSGPVAHVLVFHLSPLVGEFFVVSPRGELIKAYYRSKGTGYNPIPNAEVEQEFKKDLAYWMENFDRVKRGFELERSQKK